jgi:hypothetical protein
MKLEANWKFKNLENLEKENWGAPQFSSHLVIRTHELRKIPLDEFSVEDLRICIGQNFSLKYLIPLSLEKLNENLFTEGNFYEGDLLQSVLAVNSNYWIDNPQLWNELNILISSKLEELDSQKIKYSTFRDLNLNP